MKNTRSKVKLIKFGKQSETTFCFECKDYAQSFRTEKVKMANKVLRENLTVLFVHQINQDF